MMKKLLPIGMMLLFILVIIGSVTFAADSSGEYLKIQEPQSASPSGLSVFAYVISLLFTFGVVVALAYYTSKFWGGKLSRLNKNNNNKVLRTLSLGPHRAVYVIEMVGEYFVLGVTDHSISLLHKITSQEQIEQLKTQHVPEEDEKFELVLQQQLNSLKDLAYKFPNVFGSEQQTPAESNQNPIHPPDVEKR